MVNRLLNFWFDDYEDLESKKRKRIALWFTMIILCSCLILGVFTYFIYDNRKEDQDYWNNAVKVENGTLKDVAVVGKDATEVLCGTYFENVSEFNLADSRFRAVFLTWFRWQGDDIQDMAHNFRVYRGEIKKLEMVKDYVEDDTHYQLVRVDAIVSHDFRTRCFPLEEHLLSIFIEPNYTAKRVVFKVDTQNSNVNRALKIGGYKLDNHAVVPFAYEYRNTRADVKLENDAGKNVVSEVLTMIRLKRDGAGLYVKCFIAMYGCILWALISLFTSTYQHLDPLELLPEALFGCVANIMVGASMLPDALEMGLLEYVNIYGILLILISALVIIKINVIRREEKNVHSVYANVFGKILFYTITFFALFGNFIMPFVAYGQQIH